MKITFVLPFAGLSGGIRVVAVYAERLRKRGHSVFVASTPPTQPSLKQKIKGFLKGKGWQGKAISASHFDSVDVPHRVVEAKHTITDADLPDADVVVATWWETAEWVNALSDAKGAKAYFVQHHEIFAYAPRHRIEATYWMPMHKITISKWLVDLMRDRYNDTDVSLVLNSVDTEQFHAPIRSKQDTPTVGLLYSSIHWKGCDVSFKAIELASQKIPNLRLVAFGSDEPSADLPLPSGSQYKFRPAQDAIKNIYAACDVWLCGSRVEGFCLPLLEAMACRCPVVSTEVGASINIIQEGVNGYVVQPEDAEALADRLVQVLSLSADQWRQMSDAAYATAVSYTWDDATDLFEQALHEAIGRKRKGDLATSNSLEDALHR